jgi:hypothetical protein
MSEHEKYNLLLEFAKIIADESVYEKFENLNELNWYTVDLLRKINEYP